jgi:molecular chaperone GrpE
MSETNTSTDQPTTPNAAPGPEAATTAPAATALEEQLAAARKEAAAAQDRYLRAVADMENFRKRAVREKDELRQYGAAKLLEDIIPILDNLGLGVAAARQQAYAKSLVDGVGMVLGQFKAALERHGLKEVAAAGAAFDPHQHECISHQPSADVPAEKVMQVIRPGYTLNGRLLRPAAVRVSSGPSAAEGVVI